MPEQRVCVLDAGPLIHLDEIGLLALLDELGQVVVPETVVAEAEKHRPGLRGKMLPHIVADIATAPMRVAFAVSRHSLHAGEIAALAWAETFGADFFVSDDQPARLAAKELGYGIIGTIGVILRAVQTGSLTKTQGIALLERIPEESTLHVRRDLLEETMARLR